MKVVFTSNGKQRPLTELIKEIEEIIIEFKGQTVNTALTTRLSTDATALVGKKINHKFMVDEEEIWYTGSVISYNDVKQLHTIVYDDDEPCYFNLLEDLAVGDLVVIEDS